MASLQKSRVEEVAQEIHNSTKFNLRVNMRDNFKLLTAKLQDKLVNFSNLKKILPVI